MIISTLFVKFPSIMLVSKKKLDNVCFFTLVMMIQGED